MLSRVSDGTTMIMIMKSGERGWKVDLGVRQKVIVTTVLVLIFDSSSFAPNFEKFHLDFLINQHHRCATLKPDTKVMLHVRRAFPSSRVFKFHYHRELSAHVPSTHVNLINRLALALQRLMSSSIFG